MPPSATRQADCVVIGGGVIGLSTAYQLARDGLSVTLLERGKIGREASWAGAGILSAGSWYSDHPAMEELASLAAGMQPEWSRRLRAETGIDDEYARCGACYLETPGNRDYLSAAFSRWVRRGIDVAPCEPPGNYQAAWRVRGEAQVRNPRRLRALLKGCEALGVRVLANTPALRFVGGADRLDSVATPHGEIQGGDFVVTAGCWTPAVAAGAGAVVGGWPVRGQMLLLKSHTTGLTEIRHEYPYYLVPRRDGRVLVGATVEEVGFDRSTTESARQELEDAAERIRPGVLRESTIEAFWSGLRPRGETDLPQIGRAPGRANLWIAAGHYRSGLHLSPPTATLISRLIRGRTVAPWATAFAPGAERAAGVAS